MNQQDIAAVIAHEQAHMWFGDLVTCDWWSHLWLNEGFARYFQHFGLQLVSSLNENNNEILSNLNIFEIQNSQ